MKSQRQFYFIPEVPLAFSSFVLNFFWEMVQSPLYDDIHRKTYLQILISRLHCALGDTLILLGAYWIVSWIAGNHNWILQGRFSQLVGFTLLGLGYTLFSEWVNVDIRSAWGYSALMPRIPLLGTGVAPFLQWLVLPSVILFVTRRLR